MLTDSQLKVWLQKELARADKVLLVLSTFAEPATISAIKQKARFAGCNMYTWNISEVLRRAKGVAVRLPQGYEVAEKGHIRLKELGVSKLSPAAAKVAVDLRKHLATIVDSNTRAFVEEAIKCYEAELYRSAIVMSWLAAVGVLQNEVASRHLHAFNTEAQRVDGRWKPAITADDLGRMKEADFLDRIAAISLIGKNVKEELAKALKLRNGCGHPNSLKVGPNTAASHIETLLLNVFDQFSV